MRSEPVRPRADGGFTLVEVMVALAVLSIAMAGLGTFLVNGSAAVAQQRDQRQAVQLAGGAFEQVRALKGSSLLSGRGPVKTKQQWDQALAGPFAVKMKPYLDSMQLASDPEITNATSTVGDSAPIPTATQKLMVGSTAYERAVYVGYCEVYFLLTDVCVNPATATNRPLDSTEILQYFRVVVMVSWPHKSCPDARCSYVSSTLISRASEPTFDFKRPSPVVKTTSVTLYRGIEEPFTLDASGGYLPLTWAAKDLPAGLSLSSTTGVVSGTPTAAATTTGTVTVTDNQNRTDTGSVTWKVVLPPTVTMPPATKNYVGDTVSLNVLGAQGVGPYTYTATGLPTGLQMDSAGSITGEVTTADTYTVTVTVADVNGKTGKGTYTHTVYAVLTLPDLPDQQITLGSPFSTTAVAAGGDGKYKYTASGLPTGVTIDARSGAVTGLPAVPGRYVPTITVADGSGAMATDTFVLLVHTRTALTFTAPVADQKSPLNQPVNLPITTNAATLGNKGTSLEAVGLPPGVKWNNGKDALVGTPTSAGTYLVTLTAASVMPVQTALLTFVWTVG